MLRYSLKIKTGNGANSVAAIFD